MARNEGIRVGMASKITGAAGAAAGRAAAGDDDGRVPPDIGIEAVSSLDLEDLGLTVEIGAAQVKAVLADRITAAAQVFTTLDHVKKDLVLYIPQVPEQLPAAITGRFVNPDGSPAASVSVRALAPDGPSTTDLGPEPAAAARGRTPRRAPTHAARSGSPCRRGPLPDSGLRLLLTGGNRIVEYLLRRTDLVAGDGQGGAAPARRDPHPAAAQRRRAAGRRHRPHRRGRRARRPRRVRGAGPGVHARSRVTAVSRSARTRASSTGSGTRCWSGSSHPS